MKRASLATGGTPGYMQSRMQRRRSPTAATAAAAAASAAASSGSPPSADNMFSAGHARRMVAGGRSDKENEWKAGVLSPRVTGVVGKGSGGVRRITMMNVSEGREREREKVGREDRIGSGNGNGSTIGSGNGGGHQRMSSVNNGSRGSLMPGGKGTWR